MRITSLAQVQPDFQTVTQSTSVMNRMHVKRSDGLRAWMETGTVLGVEIRKHHSRLPSRLSVLKATLVPCSLLVRRPWLAVGC